MPFSTGNTSRRMLSVDKYLQCEAVSSPSGGQPAAAFGCKGERCAHMVVRDEGQRLGKQEDISVDA